MSEHPRAVALARAREQLAQRNVDRVPALVDGQRPAERRSRTRLVPECAQEKARGTRLILPEPGLRAPARPDPRRLVEDGLAPAARAVVAGVLGVALRERLAIAPVETCDERAERLREGLEVLRAPILAIAEVRLEGRLRRLAITRATLHVALELRAVERLPGRVVPRVQVDVERVARDVVVAVVLDRPRHEVGELVAPAVAAVARIVDRAKIRVVRDERGVLDVRVGGSSPDRAPLGEPRRDTWVQRAIEAMRELVGQAAPEALDRPDRHAQRRDVARLKPADPEERRALALETRGLGHESHEPRPADERVAAVPIGEPRVVVLDRRRRAEQGRVPADGLDAIPAARRKRDARIREARMLARERVASVAVEFLQPLDGPRVAELLRETLARALEHRLGAAAHAREIRRRRSLEVVKRRLGADAAQHEPELDRALEVPRGLGRTELLFERVERRPARARRQRKARRKSRRVAREQRRCAVDELAAEARGPAREHRALHGLLGGLAGACSELRQFLGGGRSRGSNPGDRRVLGREPLRERAVERELALLVTERRRGLVAPQRARVRVVARDVEQERERLHGTRLEFERAHAVRTGLVERLGLERAPPRLDRELGRSAARKLDRSLRLRLAFGPLRTERDREHQRDLHRLDDTRSPRVASRPCDNERGGRASRLPRRALQAGDD